MRWGLLGLFLGGVLSLLGCAGSAPGIFHADPETALVWPGPPETPRIRYFRQFKGVGDFQRQDRPSRLLRWISGESGVELPIRAPYGVAADGEGRIWLADVEAHCVHLVDLAERRAEHIVAAGRELLLAPVGVAFDRTRELLYVADSGLNRVFVFNRKNRLVGERQPAAGFSRPAGMALDRSGNLYVVDVLKGQVERFSAAGEALGAFGGGTLNRPSNLAIDVQGRIYVTDSMNFRVVVFDPQGQLLTTFGKIGDRPGHFARPRGIAVDSQGHIYVSDAAFDNIQIFDMAGNLLLHWGGAGRTPGKFNMPAGLFFDDEDRLYVADMYNRRLQIFEYLAGE